MNNVVSAGRTHYADASSTKVRRGDTGLMHHHARTTRLNRTKPAGVYGLRDDLLWATKGWNIEQPSAFCTEFLDGLIAALSRALYNDVPIKILSLDAQQKHLDQLATTNPILNLDACLQGGERLDVSRLFHLADLQPASTALVGRPGAAGLDDQIARLGGAKYVYFDDDIATGGTFRRVCSLLKRRGIKITGAASALQAYGDFKQDFFDINDARDFLLGAKSGGLVVGLPQGGVGRVPYMAPYVSLSTRARIPVEKVQQLSADLWLLNAVLLQKYAPNVRVVEADPGSKEFLGRMEFDGTTPLYEVAREHVQLFRNPAL